MFPMNEHAGAPLSQALSEEYALLRPNSGFETTDHKDLFQKVHAEPQPLTALCISGGGIRSATFALGVMQGLAESNTLAEFDYLSTVSGGGYIGSWLTAWSYRAGGIDHVIPHLKRSAPPPQPDAVDPIEHLREYNSYLTPKIGFFSTDTWTLTATVLRNMILNWLVFVPLLMAVLMLPRLALSLARLGETFELFYGVSPTITQDAFRVGLPWLRGLLHATAVFNAMRYLPGIGSRNHTERDFLKFVLLPAIGANFVFVVNDAWFTGGDLTRSAAFDSNMTLSYWTIVARMILAGLAGWLAYFVTSKKSIVERLQFLPPVAAAVILMSIGAGSAAWFLSAKVYPLLSWPLYTAVAPPLLLIGVLAAGCLFVGFSSHVLHDEDREWMARAGAWMLLFIICWGGICTLVLIAPEWAFTLPVWGKSLLGAAGAIGGWASALTNSKVTPGSAKSPILTRLVEVLAAPVFVVSFLIGLAVFTNWLLMVTGLGAHSDYETHGIIPCPKCDWKDHRGLLEGTRWEACVLLGGAFVSLSWFLAKFINTNDFSLHDLYRNRLVRAYLGASNHLRNANLFTGFSPCDDIPMHKLANVRPLHIVNLNLNLVAGERLAWQQRKAASFSVSPLHCGSLEVGYRPSEQYGGGITLGTALTISGAAASPNMGYHSSALLGFIMTLFNARLGAWLGNPGRAGAKTWKQAGPTSAFSSLVTEAFGLTNDQNEYVNLSDGGHFENLALYEMVRRRCHYIVVSDGGCDDVFSYADLGNALRKIRIDFKIPIDFEDNFLQPLRKKEKRFAIARIGYGVVDYGAEDGYLLYIKPMMRSNESPDIAAYHSDHPTFPHQSTADQFFDESQTEAYRALGLHTMDEVCAGWDGAGGIAGLFQYLANTSSLSSSTLSGRTEVRQ